MNSRTHPGSFPVYLDFLIHSWDIWGYWPPYKATIIRQQTIDNGGVTVELRKQIFGFWVPCGTFRLYPKDIKDIAELMRDEL